jgi:hypothetical protein
MAVLMLGLHGGPTVTHRVTLYAFIGYCLLVFAGILALRVLLFCVPPPRRLTERSEPIPGWVGAQRLHSSHRQIWPGTIAALRPRSLVLGWCDGPRGCQRRPLDPGWTAPVGCTARLGAGVGDALVTDCGPAAHLCRTTAPPMQAVIRSRCTRDRRRGGERRSHEGETRGR